MVWSRQLRDVLNVCCFSFGFSILAFGPQGVRSKVCCDLGPGAFAGRSGIGPDLVRRFLGLPHVFEVVERSLEVSGSSGLTVLVVFQLARGL